jgi:rare lipoprotein A
MRPMTTSRAVRFASVLVGLLLLSACGGGNYRPVSDIPIRIGPPYKVRGATYVPAADPAYDYLGYASWYGSESGNKTANGERFRPAWVTAAHRTLPLPAYVEVTSLETGRVILVRINDRGPFARSSRIIDLSRGAAEQLGIRAQGEAAVRVRIVEPPEADRARLRQGKPAREQQRVPEKTLANLRAQLARSQGAPPPPAARKPDRDGAVLQALDNAISSLPDQQGAK